MRLSEDEIFFSKIKEGENYNHRNTFKYFEDYNLSLTQRLGKIAILGQPHIDYPAEAEVSISFKILRASSAPLKF